MGILDDHINLVAVIASIAIICIFTFSVTLYYSKMRKSKAQGKLIHHSWDGVSEFASDVPVGWAFVFSCMTIWGFWYVIVGYPLNAYSQVGEYNFALKEHKERFDSRLANLNQDDLVNMGKDIFLVRCASCHGDDATGNNGKAQDLTRWGKLEGIVDTLKHGSIGLGFEGGEMPKFDFTQSEAMAIAKYVMATFSNTKEHFSQAEINQGKQLWDANSCAGCHGDDAKGQGGFAANLTEYGTPAFLKQVLSHGKKGYIGHMPMFKSLNDTQINAVLTYLRSLPPSKDKE